MVAIPETPRKEEQHKEHTLKRLLTASHVEEGQIFCETARPHWLIDCS